ncbi:MAG: hypothetical protein AAFV19_18415 [Pseudomonadota bacterium]
MTFALASRWGMRLALTASLVAPITALANDRQDTRVLVVRERHTASLLDGAFAFKVLKIRGYSIDIRAEGARTVLRLGQSLSPKDASCIVTFEEISPETRIARFVTDCQ